MYYLNNESGIKQLKALLKNLDNKNINYFKNTFKYYITTHPPKTNSAIYYDGEANDFKFVSLDQLSDIKIVNYDNYLSGDADVYIKESSFMYSVCEPFNVIIANSDWILYLIENTKRTKEQDIIDEAAETFYNWYKVQVKKEIAAINNLNNVTKVNNSIKLTKVNKLF